MKEVLAYKIVDLPNIIMGEHEFNYLSIGRYKNQDNDSIDGCRFEYENKNKSLKLSMFYAIETDTLIFLNENHIDDINIPQEYFKKNLKSIVKEKIKENQSHIFHFKNIDMIETKLMELYKNTPSNVFNYEGYDVAIQMTKESNGHLFLLMYMTKEKEIMVSLGFEIGDGKVKIYEKYFEFYEKISSYRRNEILKYIDIENFLLDIGETKKINQRMKHYE